MRNGYVVLVHEIIFVHSITRYLKTKAQHGI